MTEIKLENFCFQYEKLVKSLAVKFNRKGQRNFKDLYQEGLLAVIELYHSGKLDNVDESKQGKYVSLVVRGSMLKYISSMSGTIGVNHNKFYAKSFVAYSYMDADNQTDGRNIPQDVAVLMKEHARTLIMALEALIPAFSDNERFVWYKVIMANKPLTTKEAADFLGYKSGSSVSYIKTNIIKKLKEFF